MLIHDVTRKFSVPKPRLLPADSKTNEKRKIITAKLGQSTVITQNATALI